MPEPAGDDRAILLYELSKMPKHSGALMNLLCSIAYDYRADFPKNAEERIAYETSCNVSNVIRKIIEAFEEETKIGERLSEQNSEGESDADETGYRRRA